MVKLKKINILISVFLLLLFCSVSIRGDVFTFGPGKGGKPWGADLLGGSKLWTEPALINGIKSNVDLVLIKKELNECYTILKNRFPEAIFRFNSESLLIEIKREKGTIERIYLVNVGKGAFPVLQFSMEIPADMPKNPEWPDRLPLPPSSSPRTVIDLTGRGALYGAFDSLLSAEQIYADISSKMVTDGWTPMGKGVFLKESPMRMVLISASDDENGKAHGFILKRIMKSN